MLNITLENIQKIHVPRNGYTALPVNFAAVSTSDRGVGVSLVLHDVQVAGPFFLITAGLPEGIHEGEWEWTLTLSDGTSVTGLMMVAASGAAVTQYNKDIQYKQYGE